MDIFTQWITQIIIFLIIVAVIDLLIPENKFQKYIHLVTGLIFMLIFLKPLFNILQEDVNEQIERGMTQFDAGLSEEKLLENHTNFKKNDIQASQHAYILEQMSIQLMDLANPSLIDQHNIQIYHMDIIFTEEEELNYEHLEEVIVYVQEPTHGIGSVKPIEEIIIFPEQQGEEKNMKNVEAIIAHLRTIWEISDKKITLRWRGGDLER